MILDKTVEIPCPGCRTKIKVELGKLAPGNKVRCPGCGATVELKGDNVAKSLAPLEKAMNDLKKIGK